MARLTARGLAPEDVLAIIDAASTERDRLLLRVLWATGAHISEALDLRPIDVRRDSLVLPNLKNPSRLTKQVFLPAGQMDLPGALLLWAKEQGLADGEPLFFSRQRARGGGLQAISRQRAWEIVRAAAGRADVRVLALRTSRYGKRHLEIWESGRASSGTSPPVPTIDASERDRQGPRSTTRTWASGIKRDWQLYTLLALPLLYFVVFRYLPIAGNVIAFRKFQPGGSIFGAYWVGLTYFDTFIHDPTFWNVFKNTILLGGLNLIFSFPMPILFALLLNELRSKKFKKIVQSISYVPHFMSVVIVVGMIFQLSSLKGTINQLVTPITGNAINFMQLCVLSARRWAMTSTEHDPDWWIATLVAAVRSGWHPAGHVAALHRTQSNHSGTSCISRGRLVVAHGQVGHLQPTPAG